MKKVTGNNKTAGRYESSNEQRERERRGEEEGER